MTNSFCSLVEQALLLHQAEITIPTEEASKLSEQIKNLEVQNQALREANERMAKKLRKLEGS